MRRSAVTVNPVRMQALPTGPEPALRWVWLLRALFCLPLVAVAAGFPMVVIALSTELPVLPSVALWLGIASAAYAAIAAAWTALAFGNYSFHVGADHVTVRRGILLRSETHIPFSRVQDVIVQQGPLLRAFGLSSLVLQTAAVGSQRSTLSGEGQIAGIRNGPAMAALLLARVKEART